MFYISNNDLQYLIASEVTKDPRISDAFNEFKALVAGSIAGVVTKKLMDNF